MALTTELAPRHRELDLRHTEIDPAPGCTTDGPAARFVTAQPERIDPDASPVFELPPLATTPRTARAHADDEGLGGHQQ